MDEIKTVPVIQPYKPKPPPAFGRQKGSKNKLTLLREAVLNKQEHVILTELPKIIEVVCRKAAEGDLTAAKLILERIIPVRKQTDGSEGASKGPPVVNIIIEGAEGRQKISIETPKPSIDDAEYSEVDEEDENE